jgi:hypothetical protein
MSIILGAGLSGLIAATQIPNAIVFESNGSEALSHRAVLRFRSDVLSRLTGIPFKKVTVRKSLWYKNQHVEPTIQLANFYSRKTNGAYLDRSIWNVDAVERWIAPEDLQHQMAQMIGSRIKWNREVTPQLLEEMPRPIISTLPMPVLLRLLGEPLPAAPEFDHASITVDRYRVKGADVYQTIYYPDPMSAQYRASITGDLLIVERSMCGESAKVNGLIDVLDSFGLSSSEIEIIDHSHAQRFGKIRPIDDDWRRSAIYNLTQTQGIYSLGRFAVWKNLLLDDVAQDVAVVKRLINQGLYSASLHHNKQKG